MGQEPIPVVLERFENYDPHIIKSFLKSGFLELGFKGHYHGKKVLLKPNLITGRGPILACTNINIVRAAAEWFLDCGANVKIGDSPAFGSARQVLRNQGMLQIIEHLGLEVIEFKTPVVHTLSHSVRIGVAAEALDCDLFINLPKVKAHNQMLVTLGVKNLFGIVCGMRKAAAHMKNGSSHLKFADLMLDLIDLLPNSLTMADGIEVMHREGPVGGDLLNLGCVAISQDPVAIETAMLDILELDNNNCPVWKAAARRKLTGSCLEKIDFKFQKPDTFYGSGFIAPKMLNPIPFNPFRFMVSSIKKLAIRVRN